MRNRPKDFEIIATINTKDVDKGKLRRFAKEGATIFRINSAFEGADSIQSKVKAIRRAIGDSAKILIDLPGYKVRALYLDREINFKKGLSFALNKEHLNYPHVFDLIEEGALIRANNGFNIFTVTEKKGERIVCAPDSDGVLGVGKGLHVHGVPYRATPNSLSNFDRRLIEAIKRCKVDYVGLSFVHDVEDIKYVERRLGCPGIKCIPKIESRESVSYENLCRILRYSKIAILDRGDLAGEIGLESIWKAQRQVIDLSKLLNCKIILATQVLSCMVNNPIPTIAEIDSLYNLLSLGIDGVQLSEEISVGRYPAECLSVVSRAVKAFRTNQKFEPGKGTVLWLLGLTSSGKTSIAKRVVEKLNRRGIFLVHYDGDEVRDLFGTGHGFSPEDRMRVVKNLVYWANKSANQGFSVVVSALTAHEDARRYVKDSIERLAMIFVKCSVAECARRDPKGLYKKARKGQIKTLVGFNTPYPPLKDADLIIDSERRSVDEAADEIIDFMVRKTPLVKR